MPESESFLKRAEWEHKELKKRNKEIKKEREKEKKNATRPRGLRGVRDIQTTGRRANGERRPIRGGRSR